VFDAEATWTVDPKAFLSKSRNTPFAGWELKGKPRYTVVDGRVVWEG
jgi:dihydroorotase